MSDWEQVLVGLRAGESADTEVLKSCCAGFYSSGWAEQLLGTSYHPGGMQLTERLGELLELKPGDKVLDAACGSGASAAFLAERFGVEVVGVDYSGSSVERARAMADSADLSRGGALRFVPGDVEHLDFADGSFDAAICECAFCIFTDKPAAASEISRVLKPGGRFGLSDIAREGPLPESLESIIAWIGCIADAYPASEIQRMLEASGFTVSGVERHDDALAALVEKVATSMMGIEVMAGLGKLELSTDFDLDEAKEALRASGQAVRDGALGYVVMVGELAAV